MEKAFRTLSSPRRRENIGGVVAHGKFCDTLLRVTILTNFGGDPDPEIVEGSRRVVLDFTVDKSLNIPRYSSGSAA